MTEGEGGLEKVKICVTSFMNDPNEKINFNIFIPANLSKYSIVNHEIQMASMRASFGLSMASPSALRCCTEGTVFNVMPTVDATTKTIDITEIT